VERQGDDAGGEHGSAPASAPAQDVDHLAELDDLLAEIDEVLIVNAEEFVKNYVQKGGE